MVIIMKPKQANTTIPIKKTTHTDLVVFKGELTAVLARFIDFDEAILILLLAKETAKEIAIKNISKSSQGAKMVE